MLNLSSNLFKKLVGGIAPRLCSNSSISIHRSETPQLPQSLCSRTTEEVYLVYFSSELCFHRLDEGKGRKPKMEVGVRALICRQVDCGAPEATAVEVAFDHGG